MSISLTDQHNTGEMTETKLIIRAEMMQECERWLKNVAQVYGDGDVFVAVSRLARKLNAIPAALPLYLECAMCGASEAFVIDKHDPSVGYCFAEKQAWKISDTRKAKQ